MSAEALGELHGFSVALMRGRFARSRGTGAAGTGLQNQKKQVTSFQPITARQQLKKKPSFNLTGGQKHVYINLIDDLRDLIVRAVHVRRSA